MIVRQVLSLYHSEATLGSGPNRPKALPSGAGPDLPESKLSKTLESLVAVLGYRKRNRGGSRCSRPGTGNTDGVGADGS